jgi:prephenate dehydratase
VKLYFLGPPKTFSEQAAQSIAADLPGATELCPAITLEEVARNLSHDGTSSPNLAVMAYYNYLEGLVQECLDLVYENGLTIIGARRIAIELSIGKSPGATSATRILSHPKALAQCSDFVRRNLPGLSLVPTSSTTVAAKSVLDGKADYAIASVSALEEYGLEVVATDIGNRRHGRQNFTEFFLVAPRAVDPPLGPKCHTVLAITPNQERPGVLAEILSQVAYYGLNILKIHSRPALERTDDPVESEPQMFYLEILAHPTSADLSKCIDALRYRFGATGGRFDSVRIIGGFVEPKLP